MTLMQVYITVHEYLKKFAFLTICNNSEDCDDICHENFNEFIDFIGLVEANNIHEDHRHKFYEIYKNILHKHGIIED